MSKLGVVLNTYNVRLSQYMNLDVQGVAVVNGELVICNADGIFRNTGENDNGTDIRAWFKTFTTDLGITNKKKMRAIVISGEFEGNLMVTPIFDDDEAENHIIPAEDSRYQRTYRVPVNHDHNGMTVGVKVENINSSYFCVEVIEVLPLYLVHRNECDYKL